MATPAAAPPADVVAGDVARALAEDLGSGDATAQLLPDDQDQAYVIAKEAGVIAGRPWFDACFLALDPAMHIEWRVTEGQAVAAGTVLVVLRGRSRALVSAERPALNFLQTLSATATQTARDAGKLITEQARRMLEPAQSTVRQLGFDPIATATTLDERLQRIYVLSEELAVNELVSAIYVGYDNGDFVLARQQPCRRQPADARSDDGDAHVSALPCRSRTSPAPMRAPA